VSVDLHLSDAVVDLVGGGFDLGLRIASLPDSSLKARRICEVRRSLAAAPTYLNRQGRPTHPDDLKDQACLGYAYLPTQDRWRFTNQTCLEATVSPRGPMRVNHAEALSPALRSGLGLALQPDFMIWEDLAAGRPRALHLVLPPGEPRPTRVTALTAFLVRRLAEAPWARSHAPGKERGLRCCACLARPKCHENEAG